MTARDPDLCSVPHCPYLPHRAGLCRQHWQQVPLADRATAGTHPSHTMAARFVDGMNALRREHPSSVT